MSAFLSPDTLFGSDAKFEKYSTRGLEDPMDEKSNQELESIRGNLVRLSEARGSERVRPRRSLRPSRRRWRYGA